MSIHKIKNKAPSQKVEDEKLFRSGMKAHADNSYEEALRIYSKIKSTSAKYPEARNNIGLIYLNKGMLVEAEREIRKAIECDSANSSYH